MPKPTTSVDLSEDVARSAEALVAAGRVGSIEDVVRVGIVALEERDQEWVDYARDLWRERTAAADRGEFAEGTSAEIMARIRARVERAP